METPLKVVRTARVMIFAQTEDDAALAATNGTPCVSAPCTTQILPFNTATISAQFAFP